MLSDALRILLPAYTLIYFGTVFVLRSWLVWRRSGVNPIALGNSRSVHDFVGRLMRLTIAAAVLVIAIFAFMPQLYPYLAPIPWLVQPEIAVGGSVLLLLAFLWTIWAQAAMGTSWRIGIDFKGRTELVTTGPFRWSRNPIFLGMLVALAGLFLALPNAATLAIMNVGIVLILIQVRLEEGHLLDAHGEAYRAYRREVPRWLSFRNSLGVTVATAIVLLDQVTKAWAMDALEGVTISVIDGLVALRLGFNYGLAFGVLGDVPPAWRSAVALMPLLALVALVHIVRRDLPRTSTGIITVALVLGGAIGNLIDRVRVGAVVDFIDVYWRTMHWPAFNVADSAISVGVLLLAFSMLRAGDQKLKRPAVSTRDG